MNKRKTVGDWKSKNCKTWYAWVYIAGDYHTAKKVCEEFCFPSGLCVTVEEVDFMFGGGQETGARVGLIQYPPFEEEENILLDKAVDIGKRIAKSNHQFSFTVVAKEETHFYSRRS